MATQYVNDGRETRNSSDSGSGDQADRLLQGPKTKWFAWFNRVNALRALVAFINALILLAVPAVMAATMYVSVLAMPFIAAGLGGALGLLGLPEAVITFLAILPIIASAAIFLRFLQIHWEMYQAMKAKDDEITIMDFVKVLFSILSLDYLVFLIQRALLLDVNMPGIKKGVYVTKLQSPSVFHTVGEDIQRLNGNWIKDDNDAAGMTDAKPDAIASARTWRGHFNLYNILAGLTTLGLGGYLVSQVVPFLIPAVMSLGVPFPVAVLFGVVAAATMIAITYQLLAAAVTVRGVYLTRAALHQDKNGKPTANLNYYRAGLVFVAGVGVLASAGAAYLFFTPLLNALAPVLTEGLAIFTAVAVSVGLALLMMRLLPEVVDVIIQPAAKANESFQGWRAGRGRARAKDVEIPMETVKDKPAASGDLKSANAGWRKMLPNCVTESRFCAPIPTPEPSNGGD